MSLGALFTLFIWAAGCGGGSQRKVQNDLLALEVQQQEKIVGELRGIADSLLNTRVRMEDDLSYLRELNAKSDEEIAAMEAELTPHGDNVFKKMGRFFKRLWPF
jgi:hypothetical protein